MPQIFKALSSIIAWVLFIVGWIGVLVAIVGVIGIVIDLLLIPNVGFSALMAVFAGGVACFILSACAMKLRQMLE